MKTACIPTHTKPPDSTLTIEQASGVLNIAQGTLRRYIREGMPVVQNGTRGRGHATLLNIDAARSWINRDDDATLRKMAAEAPELLARATRELFRQYDGPDKHKMAGVLAASWYAQTTALLDYLEQTEIENLPSDIEYLQGVAKSRE